MAEKKRKSSKLLPNYFQTEKNDKFLSSTIDQLISEPKLERINGYIGSKISRNYDASVDRYIPDISQNRKNYQFEPSAVFRNSSGQINDIVTYDDLVNEIKNKDIKIDHLDNLFRSDFYSYDPYIDWDKLINFDQYYWLINGPSAIVIDEDINVDVDIVGKSTYQLPNNVIISNGMKLKFSNKVFPITYRGNEYVVEGVGEQIKLIDWKILEVVETFAQTYDELFDQEAFDEYPFDGSKKLPIVPEYVTINRASQDLNPWSRYNRWFHKDIIIKTAQANKTDEILPDNTLRAKRPIVEFRPNIKLNNFGKIGTKNAALIDTDTEDVFNIVENSLGYYVDGVNLEKGQRVIFNGDRDQNVRSKIYEVDQVVIDGQTRLQLNEVESITDSVAIAINNGLTYAGTSWKFDTVNNIWIFAQQHTKLNEGPLFDLFDADGESYADKEFTNFAGNKLFGYELGNQFDSVLGINVKTENISGIGSYLFKNYFMTEAINFSQNNATIEVATADTFFKVNDQLKNVWRESVEYQLPIIEIQTTVQNTSTLILQSIDVPIDLTDFSVKAFDSKTNEAFDITTSATTQLVTVNFDQELPANQTVIFKINSIKPPNNNGYWEIPKGLTNNPLNGSINSFTLSVLTDHLYSMAERIPNLTGKIQGNNNLRDLVDYGKYGTRLIINSNPISFSHIFLGKQEHDIISAFEWGYRQYDSFKLAFLNALDNVDSQLSPRDALDAILFELTKNKDDRSPFFYSDMLGYGTDRITKEFTITNPNITEYPIGTNFDLTKNSYEAVYIYKNNQQLAHNIDYEFNSIDGTVIFLNDLAVSDKILIDYYSSTKGCFVPVTPTKLALTPHVDPSRFIFNTSSGPVEMIREHDGSFIKSFGDYRDDIILEYELRIHNNLKVFFNPKVFDITGIAPGYFNETHINISEYLDVFREYILEWAGKYNIDLYTNSTYDPNSFKTWNFKNSIDAFGKPVISGSYTKLLRWYYGTDVPQFRPWQMLGFLIKPDWWDAEYGANPYTSGNTKLWNDLELGYIRGEDRFQKDHARPGLSQIIPVDEFGVERPLIDFLVSDNSERDKQADWAITDIGPAENAFRISSIYSFVRVIIATLYDPITLLSRTFDCGRTYVNDLDQIVYSTNIYLNPKNLILDRSEQPLIGYGNLILEKGLSRDVNYQKILQEDLSYLDFNLVYKVGGFVNKDKLQVIVDSVDPTSLGIGNILPQEDYNLVFQTSNPIDTFTCSGIIVQKTNGKYQVKGYDSIRPWFSIFEPYTALNASTLTIGGKAEPFTDWLDISDNSNPDISSVDLTTAQSVTGRFYRQGQIVRYNNNFYRVKTSHSSGSLFDPTLFQLLSDLPVKGGTTVQIPSRFSNKINQIPYGTTFNSIQEVYNFILGYGEYLKSVGFIFDKFANEFGEILDWKFSAKEFLYWSSQNWEDGHIITLSPFADELKFQNNFAVVDNLFSDFDNFTLLQADGRVFSKDNFSITRDETLCTITSKNSYEGIFFAKLKLVQKEQALVFNNTTIFNDTIYDIETGFKQSRAKLNGFRTLDWNGDFFSPGFVYDDVKIKDWIANVTYLPSEIVRFNGEYYSANKKITPEATFDFTKWTKLSEKPQSSLLPNFEYKINQFEDFYSLDIDNFDFSQQILAQKLIGFTERSYLKDIFPDSISQYKFYQGYIREKGTLNAITKLNKASRYNLKGDITINEEWAFRVGNYGGYSSYDEIEFTLQENTQIDNNYIVKFVDNIPSEKNPNLNYVINDDVLIKPENFNPFNIFPTYVTSYDDNGFDLITAGYVRDDDITTTAYNKNSLLDIANANLINEGDIIWLGFLENGGWDVYRYALKSSKITGVYVSAPAESITFVTNKHHGLKIGDIVSVVNFDNQVNGIHIVTALPTLNQFTVASNLTTIIDNDLVSYGLLYKFESTRFANFNQLAQKTDLFDYQEEDKIWVDQNTSNKWAVYQKTNNFSTGTFYQTVNDNYAQLFGEDVYSSNDTSTVIISAPGWKLPVTQSYGKIFVYKKTNTGLVKEFEYVLNDNLSYCNNTKVTDFGYSIAFDRNKDLFIIGAPAASNVVADTSTNTVVLSTTSASSKVFDNEGIVKISTRNTNSNAEVVRAVLVSPFADTTATAENARFGHSIYINDVANINTTTLIIGAPGTGTGRVFAYEMTATTSNVFLTIHSNGIEILSTSSITLTTGSGWGSNIVGTKSGNLIAISAPYYVANSTTGIVQIFDQNHSWIQTITPPYVSGEQFAYDIEMSSTGTFLFVSSKDVRSSNASYGRVYVYNLLGQIQNISIDSDHISTQSVEVVISEPDHPQGRRASALAVKTGNKVTSIEIIDSGTGYFKPPTVMFTGTGIVVAGSLSASISDLFSLTQVLDNPIFANDIRFGESISISDDNTTLAISALGTNRTKYNFFDVKDDLQTTFDNNSTKFISSIIDAGTVFVYDNLDNNFILSEELNTADILPGSRYGYNVVVNNQSIFVGAPSLGSGGISSIATTTYFTTASLEILTVDFSEPELENGVKPVVQLNYTSLGANKTISSIDILFSGRGYVNTPTALLKNSLNNVLDTLQVTMIDEKSRLYEFDKIDNTFVGWKKIREQEDVIDITKVKRIALIDNVNEAIVDYLDVIDPLKGKIAGLADRELRYKTTFDPAIYSFAVSPFTVDNQNSWLDEHVGELWWDLSNAKYKNYEQGEDVYRKNTWGQLFPGASIDVYEWVKSTLLPSEWASQADTNEGLTRGISGQPKFPDNSAVSVKQILNTITNNFENVYYYWVKNKVTLPENPERSLSAFEVARLIADPEAVGYKFAQILSKDSISLVNIKDNIVGQTTNLNIALDAIDNQNPRHTEWLLLQENNARSVPNTLLEKKLFDSLLGRDSLGNPVPDPSLADRNRYGLSIRPQQTLFKDRLSALRNLIEFSNNILLQNRITGEFDLTRLQSQEEIPDVTDGLYDGIVDDLVELDFINTIGFRQAAAFANVENGKLISLVITDPGFGYKYAPKVTIKYSIQTEAEVKLTIDSQGRVNGYTIENPGERFETAPAITIRPQTYIVRANEDYNGRWTLHEFNYNLDEWSRVRTQAFNTTLYWDQVDWSSSNFNFSKNIDYTVAGTFELDSLEDIQSGDYVKVRNVGDGRFIILERVAEDQNGDYSQGYTIVYSEKGTIQFSNDIWDLTNSNYGYDTITLEETLFDQVPDVELENILNALRYDIFIKNLKINWNKFFFVAVKYALSEQKLLDWTFKTSLISVLNNAGELTQIPVYKFNKAENYESYLREVKPYHTQLKEFTSQHTALDTFNGNITDFDLPVYYNTVSNSFETVELTDSIIDNTPYKEWKDNYLYGVERISIDDHGLGYTAIPVVTITTATGDTGYGLEVEVYLNSGQISDIIIINPGQNYLVPPTITISGGGAVTRQARASAILGLNPVRKNRVHIKFDRFTRSNEIGEKSFVDEFVCSGLTNKFELTWYADTDKINIVPTLDGGLIYSDDYEIVQSIKEVNGQFRKTSTFVFLKQVPLNGQKFNITYDKNIEIYNAIDRIDRFYNPQDGMLGDSYPQLMRGMEYPKTNILGLEFNYLLPWTTTTNSLYGSASYGELIENYTTKKLVQTATLFTNTLYLNNIEDIVVGQTVNVLNSTTNRVRTDTIVESINTNSVVITLPTYFIKSMKSAQVTTGSNITVKTKTAFNGQLKVNDYIQISDVVTSEYNGDYFITDILNNTSFVVTASSSLSTTTAVVNALSKLIVSTILEEIPVANEFLDTWTRYISNTSSYTLDTYLDINLIKKTDVIVNGTPAFDVISFLPYFEVIENPNINNRAQINVYQLDTTVTNTVTFTVYGDPSVELYTYNQNYAALDTDLVGGQFESGNLIGALGINPEEIIIDGDKFLSENASFAPEEMVPGQIVDSLGINVYTRENIGNPLIITGSFPVTYTSNNNTGTLSVDISNFSGILVHYNGKIFERVTSTNFIDENEFFVAGNEIILPPQPVTGRAGYTLIKIGSDDLIDGNQVYVESDTTIVTSLSSIDDIASAFVLVNGKQIYEANTGTQVRYELTNVGEYSNRACVKVYNLGNTPNTVQAWFFNATYPEFNRINEETFVVGGSPQSSFVITNPPAQLEPSSAHAIVEYYDNNDPEGIKRILPPWVSYYEVQTGVNTFVIDNKNSRPPSTYNITNVYVYLNGKRLRPSFDYTVNSSNSTVVINSLLLNSGDAVAVMGLVDYDYYITNNVLTLATPISNKTLKITTFTDHDDLLIRTERFTANADKKFTISRRVLDVNHVWVSINGIPLTSRYDYELMPDYKTIQINDWTPVNVGDDVIVTSFGSPEFVTNVVGYRFFKDIFDRTHYRRLTKYNTAELTRPLTASDTEIFVTDSTKLMSPNPSKNKPGVVIIDAERIEFFKKSGNVLKDLRRSTLGTGPALISEEGTKVIDQSSLQTIPYNDIVLTQHILTTSTTNTYVISTVSAETNLLYGDGIIFDNELPAQDQISVFYGGRPLRKTSIEVHNAAISYYPSTNSVSTLPPEFSINTNTNEIMLNISGGITENVKITIVQRKGMIWTGTESLLTSPVVQATFLRDKQAELPDNYYYGGDPILIDSNFISITDEDGDPLEGY